MSDTAWQIIHEAATHPLLGEYAAYDGTVSVGGATTIFSDAALITFTADTRYQNYRLYMHSTGDERLVYSRNGAIGQLQVMQPLSATPVSTEPYFLSRDVGWSDKSGNVNWLRLLNETVKSLYFDGESYLRGQTNLLKYTLPTPISYGGWVDEVTYVPYPFAWSDQFGQEVTWYRVNPLNIQGDAYLVLSEAIDASVQLLFSFSRPYAHAHMSAYTMSRSVLVPFGETTVVDPPRQLVVAGLVWRVLKAKVRNLTGDSRALWSDNLKQAAQWYAEECARNGLRRIGSQTIGWSSAW